MKTNLIAILADEERKRRTPSNPPPVSQAIVTSIPTGSIRHDTFYLGFIFQVGAVDITITDIGRFKIPGDIGTHNVVISEPSVGIATLRDANINASIGLDNTYIFAPVTPLVLLANHIYAIMSEEFATDSWHDLHTVTVNTLGGVQLLNAGYRVNLGNNVVNAGSINNSYADPNFKYLI